MTKSKDQIESNHVRSATLPLSEPRAERDSRHYPETIAHDECKEHSHYIANYARLPLNSFPIMSLIVTGAVVLGLIVRQDVGAGNKKQSDDDKPMNLLRPLAWTVTGIGSALIVLSIALSIYDRQVGLFGIIFFLFGVAAILIGLMSRSQKRSGHSKR